MGERCELLAVGAHPDDVELWGAGLLLLARGSGWRTAIVDLTGGEMGTRGSVEQRMMEAEDASRTLGVSLRRNLGLPDGRLEATVEARALLVDALREIQPLVVLAPHRGDIHPDHARAGELVRSSVYPAGIARFAPGRDPYRPRCLLYYMAHTPFQPTFIADVSDVFETKLAALRCFRSQLHREGSGEPRTGLSRAEFIEEWTARHVFYGSLVGARYGEPYIAEGPLALPDLRGILGGGR